jgi:hypothetical protein
MNRSIEPWQQLVAEWCAVVGDFPIKMVYDPNHVINKARVAATIDFLVHTNLAVNFPCNSSNKSIMRRAYYAGSANAFTVMMPRVSRGKTCAGFYCAMESLNDGVAYVTRPHFKQRELDQPQIIVFSNTLPNYTMLPEHKWEIWEMTLDKTLSRHTNTAR